MVKSVKNPHMAKAGAVGAAYYFRYPALPTPFFFASSFPNLSPGFPNPARVQHFQLNQWLLVLTALTIPSPTTK